ncbi:MAG TPA: MFS transporter [Xanthobacteraceae bacterium]|nr:MFS transporter [Xanthobacteraceae bacterium]
MAMQTVAREDNHPTEWYSDMKPQEKATFWASIGGWILDAMDVQILSFAVPTIIAAFALKPADAGFIGTVTLFTSAFGGWIAGALADRIGRVRTLQITILWFAFFTFLCGFAQSYEQLLISRALMGFGFGGEWACAAVLVGEVIRPESRGKAVGAMQSGWAVGWAIALGLYLLFFTILPAETAWRALFWVGLTPALLVFFIRRYVQEPEIFKKTQTNLDKAGKSPNFLEIFSPSILKTTILTCLLTTGAQGGYYAITFWVPTFLRTERKLTVLGTSSYILVIIIGSLIGYWVSAWLADRIGRRANFILFGVCSIITVILYTQIPVDNATIMFLGFPLGFFASGIFSGMGPFLTELFPTRIRGSGQGFAYNFGRGVASFNTLLVGLLSAQLPLGQSIGVFALVAYGLLIIAALLLPETKGRILTAEVA